MRLEQRLPSAGLHQTSPSRGVGPGQRNIPNPFLAWILLREGRPSPTGAYMCRHSPRSQSMLCHLCVRTHRIPPSPAFLPLAKALSPRHTSWSSCLARLKAWRTQDSSVVTGSRDTGPTSEQPETPTWSLSWELRGECCALSVKETGMLPSAFWAWREPGRERAWAPTVLTLTGLQQWPGDLHRAEWPAFLLRASVTRSEPPFRSSMSSAPRVGVCLKHAGWSDIPWPKVQLKMGMHSEASKMHFFYSPLVQNFIILYNTLQNLENRQRHKKGWNHP